jgi:anti-anti-sigma regulatory factor
MIHLRQATDSDLILEYSGALDAHSAEEIAAIAKQQAPALRVVIDLSRAWPIQDSALGRLVDGLRRSRPHSFCGAKSHHARLLRYLGASIDERQSDGGAIDERG